jgi:predicted site-specific integrase-resolvase
MLPSLAFCALLAYTQVMKLSSYAKKLGIHYNTAYRLYKRGQIPGYQLPTGTVIIEEPADQTEVRTLRPQLVAVYARVSSTENNKNLDTQAERLITWCHAQGWSVGKVVKECGSGINDQRPKFLALLANRDIHRIVVEHQDRASTNLRSPSLKPSCLSAGIGSRCSKPQGSPNPGGPIGRMPMKPTWKIGLITTRPRPKRKLPVPPLTPNR